MVFAFLPRVGLTSKFLEQDLQRTDPIIFVRGLEKVWATHGVSGNMYKQHQEGHLATDKSAAVNRNGSVAMGTTSI